MQTRGCRLVLQRQVMLSSAAAGSVAGEVIRELRRAGRPLPDGISGTFGWEEYYLEPGETAYVCGRATTRPAARGYRDPQVQRLIGRPDDGAFVISDLEPAALAVLLADG